MGNHISLDLPEKVKILGISGSPRKDGNTAGMVKFCLDWAKKTGYAEIEYISLADYKWYPCTGCMKCFGFMAQAGSLHQCYEHPDDGIKILVPKVIESDGLLIGFPVYSGGVPSILRIFKEKMHTIGPMSFTKEAGGLRFKPIAVISQGGEVYGGQEVTYHEMAHWPDMLIVSAWPTVDAPMPLSSSIGGILTTIDGIAIYNKNAWKKETTRTVPPLSGVRNERTLKNLGRWLAVAAMILRLGREAFKKANYYSPKPMPFTKYSVKPKPGSYVDQLIKEGKIIFKSKRELKPKIKQKIK